MAELSIKEKAKAYDEALNRAKKELNTCGSQDCDAARQIFRFFPELKESEDENADEKVRKALIKLVTNHASMDLFIEYDIHLDEALSWLEKQGKNNMGISESAKQKLEDNLNKALEKETPESWNEFLDEQKPGDKAEPKFKAGDWAVSKFDGKARQISEVHYDEYNNYYVVGSHEYDIEDYDRLHHLWTIKDAKDGDVLSYRNGQWIFIYKEKIDDKSFYYHALYSTIHQDLTIYDAGFTLLDIAIVPATKEQRELLFQKMHEAGYEWDAEKKELKKIELKSAWSEEDEEMFKSLKTLLNDASSCSCTEGVDKILSWLKSLKPQSHWKPSIAQLNALSIVSKGNAPDDIEAIVSLYQDLLKLKG